MQKDSFFYVSRCSVYLYTGFYLFYMLKRTRIFYIKIKCKKFGLFFVENMDILYNSDKMQEVFLFFLLTWIFYIMLVKCKKFFYFFINMDILYNSGKNVRRF